MSEDKVIAEEEPLEKLESEKEDAESEPARFEIVTYPTDFTLDGLVQKYQRRTLVVPGFQRKFVWTIKQASRLIESFLLGLPVPAVFLFTDTANDNKQIVVDGQQRLLSVFYFFEGYFGEETGGKRAVFALKGLNEKSPYNGKTYEDLRDTDEGAYNRLNDAVLRAFIIRQLDPEDSSSVYPIFERLNTGGTQLAGQEIRNCIYHGKLNDLLVEMNRYEGWRSVFGKPSEDRRQRDVELILRFLALRDDSGGYSKPMKTFLSRFMEEHRNPDTEGLDEMRDIFRRTTESILGHLGSRPFHIRTGLNAAVFDSVFTAFAAHLDSIPDDIKEKYRALINDKEFREHVSAATTDVKVVRRRFELANDKLFG